VEKTQAAHEERVESNVIVEIVDSPLPVIKANTTNSSVQPSSSSVVIDSLGNLNAKPPIVAAPKAVVVSKPPPIAKSVLLDEDSDFE
jgi:hypothetical protein